MLVCSMAAEDMSQFGLKFDKVARKGDNLSSEAAVKIEEPASQLYLSFHLKIQTYLKISFFYSDYYRFQF